MSARVVAPHRVAWSAVLWLSAYAVAIVLPLFALLPSAVTAGHGFNWDFALALGYAALVMLGLQFALTARFKRATAPFGIDIVYYFHRYLAVLSLVILLLHYALLRHYFPAALGDANPRTAPPYMTAGRCAMLLLLILVASSLLRKRLRLDYDLWRMSHAVVAVVLVACALLHLFGSGHYLDRPWKQLLWAALACAWMALVLYIRIYRQWVVRRAAYRVTAVRAERGRVWTLELTACSPAVMTFSPGQFAWLSLRSSPFAMHDHPFSIASSATHPQRIALSIKELGDFTATIKDIKPGETAYIDAPYGAFSIDRYSAAPAFVFLAGGIGIAPILSMLRTLADRADRRPLLLCYGNRVWDRVAFREELESLQQRLTLRVVHVLQEPPPQWSGERGFISQQILAPQLHRQPSASEFFICGPTPMTHSLERSLAALGVPAAQVHSEIFDWA